MGGAKAVDVVEGTGVAQGAHHVATVSHGQHAGSQGDGGPAAAAASTQIGLVSVAGSAKNGVVGVRSQAKFRGIGFTDQNGARLPYPLHNNGVLFGQIVLENRRAAGGDDIDRCRQIFGGLRHTVHPAHVLARLQLLIALVCLGQQSAALLQGDDGVDLGVHTVDMVQIGHHHFVAGYLALGNPARQSQRISHDDVLGRARTGGRFCEGLASQGRGHARQR